MNLSHKVALMAGLVAVLTVAGLLAPTAAQDRACAADVKKFCQGVPAGQRQGCLQEHVGDLSPACKAAIQAAQQRVQELQQACQGEVAKFCQGASVGGPLRECLQQHVSEVSPECKTALSKARPTRKQHP
jgi:hypothetical protein